MLDEKTIIVKNEKIADGTYRMVLKGCGRDSEGGVCRDFEKSTAQNLGNGICQDLKPGQFVNLKIEGKTLRRPISVSSFDKKTGEYTLLYKVVGEGTELMAEMKPGETLMVLGPLGNGFPVDKVKSAVLVGGGAGTGPLVQTAKELKEAGAEVSVVLGFPTEKDVYGLEDFRALGIEPAVSTDDGSFGFHGNAIQLIEAEEITGEAAYACGPKPMLRAVSEKFDRGYISLDIRMACGMGACMACVCKDKNDEEKYYRVCKEGPVFKIGQVEL